MADPRPTEVDSHRGAFGDFGGEERAFIDRSFRERIVLVGVNLPSSSAAETEAALDELTALVDTAGADAVARVVQRRDAPDPATFIVNALAPAEVVKIVLDEDNERIEVVVPDDQLSLAIGRRGQNVRLASNLTGWTIDILTEAEESERRQQEFLTQSQMFVDALDVDETLAQLLVAEGFSDLEEVAYVELDELVAIEGFDEGLAEELQRRALEALESRQAEADEKRKALGVADALAEIAGLTPMMLLALGEQGVKSLEDFAGLAADELTHAGDGLLKAFDITEDDANAAIMAARVKAGWIEAAAEDAAPAEEAPKEDAPKEDAPKEDAEAGEAAPADDKE